MNLPYELAELKKRIEKHARDYGLDFFDTIFEILEYDEVNQVAAYGGFPTRYPHWSFGMEYERLSKTYSYGLAKIYEMVINNDPCYAYLLSCNGLTDQKIVMAHVYAHCDFFKNNAWFSKTSRKMIDGMANHSTKVRKYIDKIGHEPVERFLDLCLSIDNLIDCHSPFISRPGEDSVREDVEMRVEPKVRKLKSKDYMDTFINPKEFLDEQKKKIEKKLSAKRKFPQNPARDVLNFLIAYAPLQNWQIDVLSIIREESYYFTPQAQTKIMNEGWATYWHSKIMTEKMLESEELIDYADHHSGTLGSRPGVLNPYKVGLELYRDIEDRWNKGKFGKEYNECADIATRKNWDRKLGKGREKIFEVRRVDNDITFIDNYLTEDFCREQKLFAFAFNQKSGNYEITSREFQEIKQRLLFSLTNQGSPIIEVVDGNYDNKAELYLLHKWENFDLKIDWAKDTIANIYQIWQRPVNLESVVDGKKKIFRFDGTEQKEIDL
jgi:stage V sporulation protein R